MPADAYYENTVKKLVARYDANDMIYQFESSRDYDPQPGLGKIVAPLLAINSADDQINPPELGIMEQKIAGVRHGRFVSADLAETRGHGTHTLAAGGRMHSANCLQHGWTCGCRAGGRPNDTRDGVTVLLPQAGSPIPTRGDPRVPVRLRPPGGPESIDVVLSGAIYGSDPPDPGRPLCVNGSRAHIDERYTGATIMSIALGEMGAVHYAWMRYRTGDSVAQQIAPALLAGRPKSRRAPRPAAPSRSTFRRAFRFLRG